LVLKYYKPQIIRLKVLQISGGAGGVARGCSLVVKVVVKLVVKYYKSQAGPAAWLAGVL
jgi:hypothetical protein